MSPKHARGVQRVLESVRKGGATARARSVRWCGHARLHARRHVFYKQHALLHLVGADEHGQATAQLGGGLQGAG